MDSRATQQCKMFPYVYAVYWLRPASSEFLLAGKCNLLAEVVPITCVMRPARTNKMYFVALRNVRRSPRDNYVGYIKSVFVWSFEGISPPGTR